MSCNISAYCLSDTGYLSYDSTYYSGGTYDGNLYYTGDSTGYYIYYSSANTQWCLSTTLGGTCLLSGKSPCTTQCPDLCEHYFLSGVCPSTTTTTTIDCTSFDFSAVFDCEVFPTTTTTTSTSTTTTTTLPPPDPCSGVSINATITAYTTTTTTSTSTTTTTTINYGCNFSGDVSFNVINLEVKCPISKEFKDCYDMGGTRYYTNNTLTNPSGGDIEVDMVFSALVDGQIRCISYVGINNSVAPLNSISLLQGSYGSYPNDCNLCFTSTTTTTTSTSTTTTTTLPPCNCYNLISFGTTNFNYTDCSGNTQNITTTSVDVNPTLVCSSTVPTYDSLGSVTELNTCSFSGDCALSGQTCDCYQLTNNNPNPIYFTYIRCDNEQLDIEPVPANSVTIIYSLVEPVTGNGGSYSVQLISCAP